MFGSDPEDDDSSAPTRPMTDDDGNAVIQDSIAARRKDLLDTYLKDARSKKAAAQRDLDANVVTPDDRAAFMQSQADRDAMGGISSALNFTGLLNPSMKKASALAAYAKTANDSAANAFADRQSLANAAKTQISQADRDLMTGGDKAQDIEQDELNFDEKQKAGQRAEDKFTREQGVLKQEDDPASPVSVAYRTQLKKLSPSIAGKLGPALDAMSATQVKQLITPAEQAYKVDQDNETKRLNRADRQDAKQFQYSQKQEQVDDQQLIKMQEAAAGELKSGRTGFGKAAQKLQSADAALALIEQAEKQPDGMDTRQLTELAGAVNNAIGGPQAQGQIEHLMPNTAEMALAKTKEYVTGKPAGAGLMPFVERFKETLQREKSVAQQQAAQTQDSTFNARKALATRRPDEVASIIQKSGGDVAKQFTAWGLPVPAGYASTQSTSAHQPGDIVQVKGKNYRVGADGDSLEPL